MRTRDAAYGGAYRPAKRRSRAVSLKAVYQRRIRRKRRTKATLHLFAAIVLWFATVYVLTTIHVVLEAMEHD